MTARLTLLALLVALAAPAPAAHPTARNADRERRAIRRAHDHVRRSERQAAAAALREVRREQAYWRISLGQPLTRPPARQLLEREAQRPASTAKVDDESAAIARARAAAAREARRAAATALEDAERDAATAREAEPAEAPPADDLAALAERDAAAVGDAARRRDEAARVLATRDAKRLDDDTAAATRRAAEREAPATPSEPSAEARVAAIESAELLDAAERRRAEIRRLAATEATRLAEDAATVARRAAEAATPSDPSTEARIAARERTELLAASRERQAEASRLAADATAWLAEDEAGRTKPRVERPPGHRPADLGTERIAMSRMASRERLAVAAAIGRQAGEAEGLARRAARWRKDDTATRGSDRARRQRDAQRLRAAKDATLADELAAATSVLERERAGVRAAVREQDASAKATAARAARDAGAEAAATAARRARERRAAELFVAAELERAVGERERAVGERAELYVRQLERATRWAMHDAENATRSDDKLRDDLVEQVLDLADEMERDAAKAEALRKKKGTRK